MNRSEYLARFKKVTDDMVALTTAKNSDYADMEDAFQNFRNVEQLGLTTIEIGILTRMSDKFQRACNLTKRSGKVTTESIQDTLKDLAVYSIILSIYLDSKIVGITEKLASIKCKECHAFYSTVGHECTAPYDNCFVCPFCGAHSYTSHIY